MHHFHLDIVIEEHEFLLWMCFFVFDRSENPSGTIQQALLWVAKWGLRDIFQRHSGQCVVVCEE